MFRFIIRGRMTLWCKGTTPSWESMRPYGDFLLVVLHLLSSVADVKFYSYKHGGWSGHPFEGVVVGEQVLTRRSHIEPRNRGHSSSLFMPLSSIYSFKSSSFSGRRWIASTAARAILFSTPLLLREIGSQLQCSSLLEPGFLIINLNQS